MREIKFRAWLGEYKLWDIEKEKWLKNQMIYNPTFLMSFDEDSYRISTLDSELKTYDDNGYLDGGLYEMPKAILMQWTGLKDSKGVDIYEGDIIRSTWNNSIFEVEWDEHNGEWIWCSDCDTTDGKYAGTEVIGNIYENKDLLNETT